MSQETLKSRLFYKFQKQIDSPISCFENFTQKLILELLDILEIDNNNKDSFSSQIIFTENGMIICGFVYIIYENKSNVVKLIFLETIENNSEQFFITEKIFENSKKIVNIVTRYHEYLNSICELNPEISYEKIDRILKFLIDSNNVGKTCKFEIPLKVTDKNFIFDNFKIEKVELILKVETAYLVSYQIKIKEENSEIFKNILDGKLSIDNVETFIKELYYNGKIVNYGR